VVLEPWDVGRKNMPADRASTRHRHPGGGRYATERLLLLTNQRDSTSISAVVAPLFREPRPTRRAPLRDFLVFDEWRLIVYGGQRLAATTYLSHKQINDGATGEPPASSTKSNKDPWPTPLCVRVDFSRRGWLQPFRLRQVGLQPLAFPQASPSLRDAYPKRVENLRYVF